MGLAGRQVTPAMPEPNRRNSEKYRRRIETARKLQAAVKPPAEGSENATLRKQIDQEMARHRKHQTGSRGPRLFVVIGGRTADLEKPACATSFPEGYTGPLASPSECLKSDKVAFSGGRKQSSPMVENKAPKNERSKNEADQALKTRELVVCRFCEPEATKS